MTVRYLTENSDSSMMIGRSDRLKVGRHQIDSSDAANTSCQIVRGLTKRLGWLWREVRLRFHQMWLLKRDASSFQLMRWISTWMNRRISMRKINYRSLRHNSDSLLPSCWNTGLLLHSVFLTCIIGRHTGLRYTDITVKISSWRSANLRIHVIGTAWHSSH